MSSTDSLHFQSAFQAHQRGEIALAASLYRKVVDQQPQHANAWHLLGLTEHQQGRHVAALELITKAIALQPNSAVYFNSYGATLLSAGRVIEAATSFHAAVGLAPQYAEAHANLATTYERLTQGKLAVASLQRACELADTNHAFKRQLALLLVRTGARQKAIDLMRKCLAHAPRDSDLWNELGNALLAEIRTDEAIEAYQSAIRIEPAFAAANFNLGNAFSEQDRIPEAQAAFAKACQLQPQRPGWQLRQSLLCPVVFPSADALDAYREEFERDRDRLGKYTRGLTGQDLLAAGCFPPFPISFQGRPNRNLKKRFAEIVRPCIPHRKLTPRTDDSKTRVGFVVTRGHEGLFLRCTGGIIEHLPASQFEVVVLCPSSCLGVMRGYFRRTDIRYVGFAETFEDAAGAIAGAQCDVLYYWEVGTDALNYLLPFAQLAPHQCTSWGSQVTSGVEEVQYYLSSEWVECAEAEQFYSETLIRLASLPTYQRRMPAPPATEKTYFGFSHQQHVYLCPQTLLKLHPEQDPLFRQILERDPRALLVLKEGRHPHAAQSLRQRLNQTCGEFADRITFLPWQSREDYYRLISIADVVLDVIHYTAGSSCYDMFSLHKPIVTLPGQLNVGRYTQACYRRMGFTDLVAKDEDDYVALAVAVGSDPDRQRSIERSLRERVEVLFEDRSAVDAHAQAFAQMKESRRAATS